MKNSLSGQCQLALSSRVGIPFQRVPSFCHSHPATTGYPHQGCYRFQEMTWGVVIQTLSCDYRTCNQWQHSHDPSIAIRLEASGINQSVLKPGAAFCEATHKVSDHLDFNNNLHSNNPLWCVFFSSDKMATESSEHRSDQ